MTRAEHFAAIEAAAQALMGELNNASCANDFPCDDVVAFSGLYAALLQRPKSTFDSTKKTG